MSNKTFLHLETKQTDGLAFFSMMTPIAVCPVKKMAFMIMITPTPLFDLRLARLTIQPLRGTNKHVKENNNRNPNHTRSYLSQLELKGNQTENYLFSIIGALKEPCCHIFDHLK